MIPRRYPTVGLMSTR